MSIIDALQQQARCQAFPFLQECAPRLVSTGYGLPVAGPVQLGSPVAGTSTNGVVYTVPGAGFGSPVAGLSTGGGAYTVPGAGFGSPVAGLSTGGGAYTVPGAGFGSPIAGLGGAGAYTGTVDNSVSFKCGDGFSWNGSNCVQTSAAEVTIGCHANQVTNYNTDTKTLICSNPVSNTVSAAGPSATQQKFTNVNGFKSKRERNVESFSNTNGKCKARY